MANNTDKQERHKLRLVRWANDGYPPIDFGNEGKAIIELVREYKNLEHENIQLKAKNEELQKLERGFYMDICRAYNAGKENGIKMFAENKPGMESDVFVSSHDYFVTEFPNFKTNVP